MMNKVYAQTGMGGYYPSGTLTPAIPVEDTILTRNYELISQLTPVISTIVEEVVDKRVGIMENMIDEKLESFARRLNNSVCVDEQIEPKIIVIEEMSENKAREKIKMFFNDFNGDIYPSELSEKLRIDYELVWKILKELEDADEIETGD